MKNSKLDKKVNKTWKQLLQANLHHDEHHACELMKQMIALEIQQKKRRH